MKELVLDVENTVTERNGKLHLDPFEPTNSLVMVGMLDEEGGEQIVTFDHAEQQPTTDGASIVQQALDNTDVLVGQNIVHDLVWLWESGFKYDGAVYDTMLGEYILQRGQKQPLSLEAIAERYDVPTKKQDTLKQYMRDGVSIRDIPHGELAEYLSADLHATKEVRDVQRNRYNDKSNVGLDNTLRLTNQLAVHLARIYQRGIKVDLDVLEVIRAEFENEKQQLKHDLEEDIRMLMGDRPINLGSPEQLSWVIFSRKPNDKKEWAEAFSGFISDAEFKRNYKGLSTVLKKQKAKQCATCTGTGQVRKTRKDGSPYARSNKCTNCGGDGVIFLDDDNAVAGLKFTPSSAKWASASGFSTSKDTLTFLEGIATSKGMTEAATFLRKLRRLSAVETYLSSFVDGIKTFTKHDGMLHVRLLQHRTGTARLSGADPNMQNMPRGGTFPVKKAFVSRWKGGKILEADFAQLEFRVAAFLSQDAVAIQEIITGFDVHSYTASVISDAGQPTTRQGAKEHTFAPLYGATGFGRTPAEAAYYEQFVRKYEGIGEWHGRLAKEVLNTGKVCIPSGREFAFPDAVRRRSGGITHFTQVKNYPVQAFATADIVPLVLIYVDRMLQRNSMLSCIVNTVHDSIVIDVHPDEEAKVLRVIEAANNKLNSLINSRWGIDFNVPLLLEAKIGDNWLDNKSVA